MCVFCGAVPMVVSLGAVATAKQKQAKREANEGTVDVENEQEIYQNSDRWTQFPAEKATMIVIAGLIVGSAVYHSRISPV